MMEVVVVGVRGVRFIILGVATVALLVSLLAGFAGARQPGAKVFVRGDYNLDGQVCMSDAMGLLRLFWGQDCYPLCEDAADSNDDGLINLSDVIDILDVVFMAGPRWANLKCSPDNTTGDSLGCEYEPARCEGPPGSDQGIQTGSDQP